LLSHFISTNVNKINFVSPTKKARGKVTEIKVGRHAALGQCVCI